ncbi:MAG: exo-alpha-sialidase [Gammaproteobacteria bacterium]|nr:exo-alpha-sialidase [Gammaproteobacteria bacterium]MDE2024426.1 exo-alpha-sialidase [Gammaproteobacteria bacterium]
MTKGYLLAKCVLLLAAIFAASCGGGSNSSTTTPPPPLAVLPPPGAPLVRVSGPSPYPATCGGGAAGSVNYEDAEVEPYVAVNPANPSNVIGIWQQDRWSDGGAHGLVIGTSLDGGKTWSEQPINLSVCGGGNSSNGGNYARASDPWVTFSPNGVAYVISISFTAASMTGGALSSVLVSRSADGGATWSNPVTLILDGASAFNDKETITADPNNSNYVYAVWDRLDSTPRGPAYFARSTDGGNTWQTAVPIYDPGVNNQTIGNEIVGLPDGSIVDVFEEIDSTSANTSTGNIRVMRSTDQGATWSAPVTVAQDLSVGTDDPNTGNPVRDGGFLPQIAAGAGKLVVVWQDARFSGGLRDGIALSQSSDNGQTWSTPVEINSVPAVEAFTPSVAIMANGTIGVSYFDFRNNTTNPGQLITDYWFTSSTDGVNWSEQHIAGPFDLDLAPDAGGLFLGDYQALTVIGQAFVPFFVQTNNQGTANRTDSFVLPPQPVPLTLTRRITNAARPAPATLQLDAAARQRMHAQVQRFLRGEIPGWERFQAQRLKTSPP